MCPNFVLSRYLPFVHLQHVGGTLVISRLRWTVQAGSRATWASMLTSRIHSGTSVLHWLINTCSTTFDFINRLVRIGVETNPFLKWGCWTTEQEHDPVRHAQLLYIFPFSAWHKCTRNPHSCDIFSTALFRVCVFWPETSVCNSQWAEHWRYLI